MNNEEEGKVILHRDKLSYLHLSTLDEEEEDEDLIEYTEQMAVIEQEEFVDEEEDEDEESEIDAMNRIQGSITEKFEEMMEAISNIQVCAKLCLYNSYTRVL